MKHQRESFSKALPGLVGLATLMLGAFPIAEANSNQQRKNPSATPATVNAPLRPSNGNIVIEPGVSQEQKERDVNAHKHPSRHHIQFRKHGNGISRD